MVTSAWTNRRKNEPEWQTYPKERLISQLIDVLDDVRKKGRKGKAAINMSFSWNPNTIPELSLIMFRK